MGFIIGLLTFVMVLDCMLLILLVLVQLPKKEAGAGLAFGGAASDALFGAGSGNVLTKVTKYAATVFFVLALVLSILQGNYRSRTGSQFMNNLQSSKPSTPVAATPAAPGPSAAAVTRAEATNQPAVPAVPAPTPAVPASTNK